MPLEKQVQDAVIRKQEGTEEKPAHFEIDPSRVEPGRALHAIRKEVGGDLVHCWKAKGVQENPPVNFYEHPRTVLATVQYGGALYTIKG